MRIRLRLAKLSRASRFETCRRTIWPSSSLAQFRTLVGGFGWTAFDQGLSSLINLMPSILAARLGGAALLGQFTIAFTIYLIVLGLQRCLITEPLMSLPIRGDKEARRSAATASGVFACGVSAVLLPIGLVTWSPSICVLAVLLPGVLIQDFVRFDAFRQKAPGRAAGLDGAWLVLVIASFPLGTWLAPELAVVAGWAGGATVSGVLGLRVARLSPVSIRRAFEWWRREARRLGTLLTAESITYTVSRQGVMFGLVAFVGIAELGNLRAAQVLLAPAATALLSFNLFMLPRLVSGGSQVTSRQAINVCLVAACLSVLSVVGCLLVSPMLSSSLFGEELEVKPELIAILGGVVVAGAASSGMVLHLKVMRRLGVFATVRIVVAICSVPIALVAASSFGVIGFSFALLVQAVLTATGDLVAWRTTRVREVGVEQSED